MEKGLQADLKKTEKRWEGGTLTSTVRVAPPEQDTFQPQNRWKFLIFLYCKDGCAVSRVLCRLLKEPGRIHNRGGGWVGVIASKQRIHPSGLQHTAFPGRTRAHLKLQFRRIQLFSRKEQLDPPDIMMTVPRGSSLTYTTLVLALISAKAKRKLM